MAKYCTNCGVKLIKGTGFCKNCGTKVETPPIQVIPQEPIQQQEQDIIQQPITTEPSKKSNKKLLGIIEIIIIIAVVVIVSLYLFVIIGDDSTSTNTAANDIIGAWMMTYDYYLDKEADELGISWEFKQNGTLIINPPLTDGFNEYSISNNEICLSDRLRIYYPEPHCYELTFGPEKRSIILEDNGEPVWSFQRIV